jgi:hypothetical protein
MRGHPGGVGNCHAGDESPDLGVDGRATSGRAARQPGPVLAKATPLPPQDGVRGHDHEGLPPPGPDPGQSDPEKPVRCTKLGPSRRSLVDGELLAQSQVLEGKLAVAPDEEGEEPNQVECEGNHRARILPGSVSADQVLGSRTGFWRGTGSGPGSYVGQAGGPSPFGSPTVARGSSTLRPSGRRRAVWGLDPRDVICHSQTPPPQERWHSRTTRSSAGLRRRCGRWVAASPSTP